MIVSGRVSGVSVGVDMGVGVRPKITHSRINRIGVQSAWSLSGVREKVSVSKWSIAVPVSHDIHVHGWMGGGSDRERCEGDLSGRVRIRKRVEWLES